MIPTLQFADHHQPRTGAASIAVIAASAVAIVEPEAVFAAAERARAVLIGKEAAAIFPASDPERALWYRKSWRAPVELLLIDQPTTCSREVVFAVEEGVGSEGLVCDLLVRVTTLPEIIGAFLSMP